MSNQEVNETATSKEKLEEMTTINFSITKCPMKVFKRFSEFCKKDTNDNYSFGLKMLLDARESNIKEVILYEQYMQLKDEVEQIKHTLSVQNEVQRSEPGPKTLGSGNLKKK
jgi:hypothetical protein